MSAFDKRVADLLSTIYAAFAAMFPTKDYNTSGDYWSYGSTTTGIANTTTAVTIKAAAGAGIRNYITGIQISSDTLGTATVVQIRDGAAGTVLWSGKLPTTAQTPTNIPFKTPLKGTANTLLEVVTITATGSGGVFVNAQGFVGA